MGEIEQGCNHRVSTPVYPKIGLGIPSKGFKPPPAIPFLA